MTKWNTFYNNPKVSHKTLITLSSLLEASHISALTTSEKNNNKIQNDYKVKKTKQKNTTPRASTLDKIIIRLLAVQFREIYGDVALPGLYTRGGPARLLLPLMIC